MILALVGEETFLVRKEWEKFLAERLPFEVKDFNFDQIDGADVDAKRVMEMARTLPLMASRRLVWIKNAHELKKGESDRLGPLLKEIPETTDLLLTGAKIDRRLSFWQKVAEVGGIREFKPLYPREVPQWIQQEARAAGFRIAFEAAEWMVSALGTDLSLLDRALEKIKLLKGDARGISLTDVESSITSFSWRNVFDLADVVGKGDRGESFRLFAKMFSSGESPVALAAILARHFRILFRVKEGETAGIPPFFLNDYRKQAERLDRPGLIEKLDRIYFADWRLKSSPLGPRLVFERLLMELCHGGQAGDMSRGISWMDHSLRGSPV